MSKICSQNVTRIMIKCKTAVEKAKTKSTSKEGKSVSWERQYQHVFSLLWFYKQSKAHKLRLGMFIFRKVFANFVSSFPQRLLLPCNGWGFLVTLSYSAHILRLLFFYCVTSARLLCAFFVFVVYVVGVECLIYVTFHIFLFSHSKEQTLTCRRRLYDVT